MSRFLFFFLVIPFLSAPAAAETVPSWPGPLVEVDWLKQNRQRVVVIDLRAEIPDKNGLDVDGHIPGAILLSGAELTMKREVNGVMIRAASLDGTALSALMSRLGIDRERGIVITTPGLRQTRIIRATRLYWTLKRYAHRRVALLNGGNARWSHLGQPLTQTITPAVAAGSDYQPGRPDDRIHADLESVRKRGDDVVLLDVREPNYYSGDTHNHHFTTPNGAGHIPGALNLPTSLMTDLSTGKKWFRDSETIREEAEMMDVDIERPAIVYCDIGNYGSLAWFVLHELLGNTSVRLFDGSIHHWTLDPQRPVKRGDEP